MSDAQEPTEGATGFWRHVLWFGLDVDPRRLGSILPVAVGVALGSGAGVLYLLGEAWSRLSFLELIAIVAGLGLGTVGVLDLVTRRLALLAAPMAQTLVAVSIATIGLRLTGDAAAARSVLAWSLCLHLLGLALLARLWGTLLWQRRLARDALRRKELLAAARRKGSDHLVVRVAELDGGAAVVELLDGSRRRLRAAASVLSRRPRVGLVYLLPHALVIDRALPSSDPSPRWERHIVRADRSLMLGTEPEVAPAEVSTRLANRAGLALFGFSLVATAVSAAIAVLI
jgi:hypothetical protein